MRYETKLCPRCGAELYADMSICYGCLYDFTRGTPEGAGPGRGAGAPAGDTAELLAAGPVECVGTAEPGMFVMTPLASLWTPVAPGGSSLGRDPSNDVVLHSPAVSRRHLRLLPTPDGMEVADLGSTNPATYRGREVAGRVVVPYGDAIDVCGCRLVMTGPPATT